MITLFHHPRTRSTRFIFLLEELDVPYRVQEVSIRSRDGTGAVDPANPHPHGKVPAIVDDGELVFESSAIALYLADKYRKHVLGPLNGEPGRGDYVSWLSYYCGVLEPAFMSKFQNTEVPRGTAGWVPVDEVMPVLIARLEAAPYLLGESFSAADVLFGSTFALFAKSPIMPQSAAVEQYVQRIVARPAYGRAMARDSA